jgi:hypothetical protein
VCVCVHVWWTNPVVTVPFPRVAQKPARRGDKYRHDWSAPRCVEETAALENWSIVMDCLAYHKIHVYASSAWGRLMHGRLTINDAPAVRPSGRPSVRRRVSIDVPCAPAVCEQIRTVVGLVINKRCPCLQRGAVGGSGPIPVLQASGRDWWTSCRKRLDKGINVRLHVMILATLSATEGSLLSVVITFFAQCPVSYRERSAHREKIVMLRFRK